MLKSRTDLMQVNIYAGRLIFFMYFQQNGMLKNDGMQVYLSSYLNKLYFTWNCNYIMVFVGILSCP